MRPGSAARARAGSRRRGSRARSTAGETRGKASRPQARAALRALAGRALGRRPAAPAEAVRPVPLDDLEARGRRGRRAARRDGPQRAQRREGGSPRAARRVVDPAAMQPHAVEQAEEVARVGLHPECPEVVGERELGASRRSRRRGARRRGRRTRAGCRERGRGLERGHEDVGPGLDYARARPSQQGPSVLALLLVTACRVRRRHVERRVAVEEPDRPQVEAAVDDRHHGPVLEAREVVRAEHVPEHDVLALERSRSAAVQRGRPSLAGVLVRDTRPPGSARRRGTA